MISKSNKFPTRVQFLTFRSRAKQLVTPHLRILYNSRSLSNIKLREFDSRLSVIVPVKVSKRAVVRNSFKRLAYDLAWKTLKDKNLDCIIIFKPISLLKGASSKELITNELSQIAGIH